MSGQNSDQRINTYLTEWARIRRGTKQSDAARTEKEMASRILDAIEHGTDPERRASWPKVRLGIWWYLCLMPLVGFVKNAVCAESPASTVPDPWCPRCGSITFFPRLQHFSRGVEITHVCACCGRLQQRWHAW